MEPHAGAGGNAKSSVEVVGRASGTESAGKEVEESRAPKEVDGCSWPAARSTSSTRLYRRIRGPGRLPSSTPGMTAGFVGDEAAVLIEFDFESETVRRAAWNAGGAPARLTRSRTRIGWPRASDRRDADAGLRADSCCS